MQAIYHTSYTPIYAQIELVDPKAEEPYRAEQWVEEDAPDGFLGPHGLVVSTMNDMDVEVTVFEGPRQPEGRLCLSGALQIGHFGLELGTISERDQIAWPAGWTGVSVFVNAWPGPDRASQKSGLFNEQGQSRVRMSGIDSQLGSHIADTEPIHER